MFKKKTEQKDEGLVYRRVSKMKFNSNILFALFNYKRVAIRLWELENFIQVTILKGEMISLNKDNDHKIRLFRDDYQKPCLSIEIDEEYLNKSKKFYGRLDNTDENIAQKK